MTEQLPRPLHKLRHAWNSHDAEADAACFAPDYRGTDIGEAEPLAGRAAVRRQTRLLLRAFPDLRISCDARLQEGEQVPIFWQMTGTHAGSFLNIPPTGRPVAVAGAMRLTLCQGQIQSADVVWDLAGLLRQLGLLPRLRAPEGG